MRRGVVFLFTVGALLAPATASAAPAFTPETVLAPGGPGVSGFTSDVSTGGQAIVAWQEGRRGVGYVTRVVTRPPGGAWSAPETLGVQAPRKAGLSASIADTGAAAVGFQDRPEEGTRGTVYVASRAPGAPFAPAEAMTETTQSSPRVGIDAAGTVTLLYTADGTTRQRQFPAGTPALAGAPVDVQAGCGVTVFDQAPTGDAIAGLICSAESGLFSSVRFIVRRGGAWAVARSVDGSGPGCPDTAPQVRPSAPTVAIGSAGDIAASYQVSTVTTDCQSPQTATTSQVQTVLGGADLSQETTLATRSQAGTGAFSLALAQLAPRPGGLLVAYPDVQGAEPGPILVRDLPGDPVRVGDAVGTTVELSASPGGHALLQTTTARPDGGSALAIATREPGAAFGPFADPSAGLASGANVSMGDTGDGLIAYTVYDGVSTTVRVRGYDVSPPAVVLRKGVRKVAAGRSVRFAPPVGDLVGPVSVAWNFGDGTPEVAGYPVSHRFAKRGRYTVGVRVTDAVGNVVSGALRVRAVKPPRLSRLSVSPKRVGRTTRLRFRLSQRARVRVTLQRRDGTAWTAVKTVTRRGTRGANRVRVRFARPPAGRYRLVVRPVRDGVGGAARTVRVRR